MSNAIDPPSRVREGDREDSRSPESNGGAGGFGDLVRAAGDVDEPVDSAVEDVVQRVELMPIAMFGDQLLGPDQSTHLPDDSARTRFRRSPTELEGLELGRYVLVEYVGGGGMGVVYRAHQRGLERHVAVKLIRAGEFASQPEVDRFREEAEAAGRLQHPGIVHVHEFGEERGFHLLAMEFVEGRPLSEEIRERPLANRRAAEILVNLAEAVAYAHEADVVHRDLKPANVMLGNDGRPRILDFGLARRLDRPGETVQAVMGTAPYMSPEQAMGLCGDERTDVYGLGAILYALLTGRPPFTAPSLFETLQRVRESEPPRPSVLNPSVDRGLEKICLRCLRREPRERYGSAADVAEDLGRYLDGLPIQGVGVLDRIGSLFGPKWYTSTAFATRVMALVMAIISMVTHLTVFAAVQVSPECWTFCMAVLATGLVSAFVALFAIYIPRYWELQPVERASALSWAANFIAYGSLLAVLTATRPHTVETLLREFYPVLAMFSGIFAFALGAYDGRSLISGLVAFGLVPLVVAFPLLAPLLFGIVAPALMVAGWCLIHVPEREAQRG